MSGIEATKGRANIEIIQQTETKTGLGGHYFIQPDYQFEISKYIKTKIRNNNEIY